MTSVTLNPEAAVLEAVQAHEGLTLDQLVGRLEDLRWCQIFHAVDTLSRNGALRVIRKGIDYELYTPLITEALPRHHLSSGLDRG